MKSLMYAMIIGLTTYVPGQAMPYDSTATKEKKAITIYANRIVQYGKNGFAFAKNISPEVSASIVSAYDKTNPRNPGWNMSIDWMRLNPLWAPNLVTEFSFTTTRIDKGQTNKNPGYFGFHYTLNHNPIFVRLAKQNIPLIHINHRWDSAEIGFRTWSFNGFSSQNNTLQSNPTIVSDDSTITTTNTQGAIMFGYALSPVKNGLTSSGLSEVVWWASNSVNLQTKEVYIANPLTQSLDIQIGYKYVNIENNQHV